jgi:hypothetical protein
MTTAKVTDAATLFEARRLDAMVEKAIETSAIPPRPDFVSDNDSWRIWFDDYERSIAADGATCSVRCPRSSARSASR